MKPSPRFRRLLDAGDGKAELIPILMDYLERGGLPDPLTISVRGGTGDRPHDDWFHPSSHPLMTDRQLYYLLTEPDQWNPDPFGYQGRMSTLIGSVLHEVMETALMDLKYLVPLKGTCLACGLPQPSQCREHGVVDLKTRARGHVDGILNYNGIRKHFEFKTANSMVLRNLNNNDIEAFKIKWPSYWAQAQEYLRMSGLSQSVILVFQMGHPWVMREFHIEIDHEHCMKVERKYLLVREAIANGTPPSPCCAIGSAVAKKCRAMSCAVKMAS